MWQRKFEFSKVIVLASYLLLVASLALFCTLLNQAISQNNIYVTESLLNTIAIYIVTPSFGLVVAANSFYYIKSKAENLIRLKVVNIASMIDIQKANPEFAIYQPIDIQNDATTIDNTIENAFDSMMGSAINENSSS